MKARLAAVALFLTVASVSPSHAATGVTNISTAPITVAQTASLDALEAAILANLNAFVAANSVASPNLGNNQALLREMLAQLQFEQNQFIPDRALSPIVPSIQAQMIQQVMTLLQVQTTDYLTSCQSPNPTSMLQFMAYSIEIETRIANLAIQKEHALAGVPVLSALTVEESQSWLNLVSEQASHLANTNIGGIGAISAP